MAKLVRQPGRGGGERGSTDVLLKGQGAVHFQRHSIGALHSANGAPSCGYDAVAIFFADPSMSHIRVARILFIALSALSIQFSHCSAAANSDLAQARIATDSKYRVPLDEAAALLDGWRGDSAALTAAKVKLDRILRANPRVAAAHLQYARYHLMRGYISNDDGTPESMEAAQRSLDEALRIDPAYAEAYVLQGHLYYSEKRLGDAEAALAKAEKIGTNDPWLQLNTADVLIAQGKLDEAELRYKDVVRSGTPNAKAMLSAFSGLIKFYEKSKRFDEAEAMYQQQIAYEPQTAWLYGNYGAFLLCRKDDFKGAVVQFRQALSRMNYGMARSGLSASLYRQWASDPQADGADAAYKEAQGLSAGTPFDVVYSFCRGGMTVKRMLEAADPKGVPAR